MLTIYVISLAIVALSGVLIDSHRRSWRAAQLDSSLGDRDRRFARSQYRRRMQASGIIGILGAAIGLRPLLPHDPWAILLYLGSLVGACACMMLLAALDVLATRQNYARLRSEQLAAQIQLARGPSRDER
jgi:hypothetical protein